MYFNGQNKSVYLSVCLLFRRKQFEISRKNVIGVLYPIFFILFENSPRIEMDGNYKTSVIYKRFLFRQTFYIQFISVHGVKNRYNINIIDVSHYRGPQLQMS